MMRRLPQVALVALVALTGACGIPTASSPTPIPRSDVPTRLLVPPKTTTVGSTLPQVGAREQIYLVGSGQHVVGVNRDVTPPATLNQILGALFDGPTQAESSIGYQTFLTGTPGDVHASRSNGIATVDFTTNPFEIVGPDQTVAVAQVVFTAMAQPGITGVLFEIDGNPIEVPTSAGISVPGPVNDSTYTAQAPLATGSTAPQT